VKVPDGFSVTAQGFRHFIRTAQLDDVIKTTLADLDTHDILGPTRFPASAQQECAATVAVTGGADLLTRFTA
jgi:phosphoenolpyruvate synthase/pyruvate phosphate dikinase